MPHDTFGQALLNKKTGLLDGPILDLCFFPSQAVAHITFEQCSAALRLKLDFTISNYISVFVICVVVVRGSGLPKLFEYPEFLNIYPREFLTQMLIIKTGNDI